MRTVRWVLLFSFLWIGFSTLISPFLHAQGQLSPQQREFNEKVLAACSQGDDSLLALFVLKASWIRSCLTPYK
jgi:hypothetical protein